MTSLNQLFGSYKSYIAANSPGHIINLSSMERHNPESARAEAVVHNLLLSNEADVIINEDPTKGGADLICTNYGHQFLVEVTSFESKTVSKKSKIPDNNSDEIKAFAFSHITLLLQRKASAKVDQLADEPYPRILAITSEHIANSVLFSKYAVKELITGITKIRVDLNKRSAIHHEITELHASVFFKSNSEGKIEVCRKSISAILLVQVNNDSCRVYGLLHPEPVIKFRYELLPNIPFLRINPWPIKNNKIWFSW